MKVIAFSDIYRNCHRSVINIKNFSLLFSYKRPCIFPDESCRIVKLRKLDIVERKILAEPFSVAPYKMPHKLRIFRGVILIGFSLIPEASRKRTLKYRIYHAVVYCRGLVAEERLKCKLFHNCCLLISPLSGKIDLPSVCPRERILFAANETAAVSVNDKTDCKNILSVL